MKPKLKRTQRRRGTTLLELLIAAGISTVAAMGAITLFVMVGRFTAQGMVESRIVHRASLAIERMSRSLNSAYRPDALVAENRPVISQDRKAITFAVPLEGGGDELRRFRFDPDTATLHFERRDAGGAFTAMAEKTFLSEVDNFFVENQEGILSIVLSMRVDMARNGEKRYTMVVRALPRNL